MVKASNSWLFSQHDTWQSPNFNYVSTSIRPVQPGCLPASATLGTYTNVMMTGTAVPSSLKSQENNGAQGIHQSMPPRCQNLLPAMNTYLKEGVSLFSNGFAGEAALNTPPGCQRKFVIFDQSGNETRLIYSSFFPSAVKPATVDKKFTGVPYLGCEENGAKMEPINVAVSKLQEASDENHLSGEESEMHEDTEEINALLYSDDDDYDDDSDDDEVTSTAHSPTLIGSCGIQGQVEEITEEVTDSCDQIKRQKLLDGGYKRSSLVDTFSSTKVAGVYGYDYGDAESSCAIGQNQEDEQLAILGNKQLKKEKVRATLKILESIIPGAKDKDPLLVLDVAIDYLKSLKLKAKTLGVNYS